MVPAQGFEPWTLGLKGRCSARLSYTGGSGPGYLAIRGGGQGRTGAAGYVAWAARASRFRAATRSQPGTADASWPGPTWFLTR